ncbi:uncharacterized protein V2V93DRAFT_328992 [Kockiozyma suomiensis]|uniref:uncharacterized protein n=1 Tax=Kockiozyma suomiensis TaxID=1337062 RepID=UPI0033438F2C
MSSSDVDSPETVNIRAHVGDSRYQENILDFALIKRGLLNPTLLRTFLSNYFVRHHHYLPLVPYFRAALTDELLSEFVVQELYLLTAMVIVASRYVNQLVNDRCWKYMQQLISDLVFGTDPSVGTIESLLLLSEKIPRMPGVNTKCLHYHEERMSWTLIGFAIRLSYYLGINQKTLISLSDCMDDATHRQRLAWTYCYMHDRQESIRLGKAFWSRGSGLCFQNPDIGASMLESSLNFSTLSISNGNTDDYSSHVQAQIELMQILTNIHDTLHPSRDRTIALVYVGEYYRILDDYTRSFTAFKLAWQQNSWHTFPLNETVSIAFHYAKLYAYGIALQSHLRRKTTKHKEALDFPPNERTSLGNIVFPRGLIGSPDAKFILESEKAAVDLLTICIAKLHTGGALAYLPSPYYGYISYAVVILIKIVFTGAVVANEQQNVMSLVRRAIAAFVELAGTADKQHPLLRRIDQLYTLVKELWNAEGGATVGNNSNNTANTPKRPRAESGFSGTLDDTDHLNADTV